MVDPNHKTQESENGAAIGAFVWASIAVVVICIVYATALYFAPMDRDARAAFGDMFGGLNTLFSGLAFAGLVYAILLQRKELALQRQELVQTRTELQRSTEAQDKSQAALNEQVQMLRETSRLELLSHQPNVIVYTEADDSRPTIILLIVKNIGKDVAKNITFTLDPRMPSHAFGITMENADPFIPIKDGPFIDGISSLPPSGSRRFTWGQFGGLLKHLGDTAIPIVVNFRNGAGAQLDPITSLLDISSYRGTDAVDPDGARACAKELKKIAQDLHQMVTGSKPLSVITQSKQDAEREYAARISAMKARTKSATTEHPVSESERKHPE